MAGFSVPRHEIDHDKHGYVPQVPVALGTTQEMLGPIYDVMQQHNYGQVPDFTLQYPHMILLVQINTIVNELKTLSTPMNQNLSLTGFSQRILHFFFAVFGVLPLVM